MSKQDIDAILARHTSNIAQISAAFSKAGENFNDLATADIWRFFERTARFGIVIAAEYESGEPKAKKERKPRVKKSAQDVPSQDAE